MLFHYSDNFILYQVNIKLSITHLKFAIKYMRRFYSCLVDYQIVAWWPSEKIFIIIKRVYFSLSNSIATIKISLQIQCHGIYRAGILLAFPVKIHSYVGSKRPGWCLHITAVRLECVLGMHPENLLTRQLSPPQNFWISMSEAECEESYFW